MITSKIISRLCNHGIGTKYESLLTEIANVTDSIENHLVSTDNSFSLESFRKEYNQRFYQLFELLLLPVSKLEKLPSYGEHYYSSMAVSYNTSYNKCDGMKACVFIDRTPYTASTETPFKTREFIRAVNSKLPKGYEVEFVGTNSQAHPIVTTLNDGCLYIVQSHNNDTTKIKLKSLDGYSVENLPMSILTEGECIENHAQSFIVEFISLFNLYYPSCEWRFLTKSFRDLVWDEYIKYMDGASSVDKKYLTSQLTIYSQGQYGFLEPTFYLFASDSEKLKLKYMSAFCSLYKKNSGFPLVKYVADEVSKF